MNKKYSLEKPSLRKVLVRNTVSIVISFLFGIGLYKLVIMSKNHGNNWDQFSILSTLSWGLRIITFVLVLLSLYYYYRSNKDFAESDHADDEEVGERKYLMSFRLQGIADTMANFGMVLSLSLIIITMWSLTAKGISIWLYFLDLSLLLSNIFSSVAYKWNLRRTRGIDIGLTVMPNEAVKIVYQYDEAEQKVIFEQNYKIVFYLNKILMPILYLFVLYFSAITDQFQFVALGILIFIHLFINVMQYVAVRNFYK